MFYAGADHIFYASLYAFIHTCVRSYVFLCVSMRLSYIVHNLKVNMNAAEKNRLRVQKHRRLGKDLYHYEKFLSQISHKSKYIFFLHIYVTCTYLTYKKFIYLFIYHKSKYIFFLHIFHLYLSHIYISQPVISQQCLPLRKQVLLIEHRTTGWIQ